MTPKPLSSHPLFGIGLVLLSAVGLAAQNVVLRLFFSTKEVLGLGPFGGFIQDDLSNILFLLAIRTACMTVLLAIAAPLIYRPTYADLRRAAHTPHLRKAILGGGTCSIAGLVFLYTALSQLPTGVAIATFFVYPAITVLLAWQIFHQRPSTHQLVTMGGILSGVFLLNWVPPATVGATESPETTLGFICALFASLGFGLYGIFAEMALRPYPSRPHLHPIPFSLSVFAIGMVLSSGITILLHLGGQSLTIPPATKDEILIMTLICAGLTLVAYVLNNFGVRYIGAALTALITAMVPSLTTVFAWGVLNEVLRTYQILGIGMITVGVAALSVKVGDAGDPP
ncbi:MAG: DMT family transporter [Symploca sp. SIO2B6]|nr:DMT family transporter [Symploca sp. SIO2B6]